VGIKAAVHGVDPEAVEEAGDCSGRFFRTFIAFVSCGNNLPVYKVTKACPKSSRYPLTCPRGVCVAHGSLALSDAPTQVNGHEKIFKTDY